MRYIMQVLLVSFSFPLIHLTITALYLEHSSRMGGDTRGKGGGGGGGNTMLTYGLPNFQGGEIAARGENCTPAMTYTYTYRTVAGVHYFVQ